MDQYVPLVALLLAFKKSQIVKHLYFKQSQDCVICVYFPDLEKLVAHERSKNSSWSTCSETTSTGNILLSMFDNL